MKNNSLLEQIRQLNGVFLREDNQPPTLDEGVKKLAEITGSMVLVLDNEGIILAGFNGAEKKDDRFENLMNQKSLLGDPDFIALTKTRTVIFDESQSAGSAGQQGYNTVIPISTSGKRFSTLLLHRKNKSFESDQLILTEIAATLFGLFMINRTAKQEDEDTRNRELAVVAFESLSYSEVEAIQEILKNIQGTESIIVASKIADNLGITRSVIVNALRKFESAGIIESRSLGMKGTLIRVKNKNAFDLIASQTARLNSLS